MINQALYFSGQRTVEIRKEPLPEPETHEILIQTTLSAISAGTEMLVYRGQVPESLVVDESLPSLAGVFTYPLRYGYCTVGRVIEAGSSVAKNWIGQRVFAFQPHQQHFITTPDQAIHIPDGISDEAAVFLPNMETAVTLVQDCHPLLGEHMIVFGQGVVGLLCTALLAQFPLSTLISADPIPLRREKSNQWGADHALDPADPGFEQTMHALLGTSMADLCLEISGVPAALQQAIRLAGFDGRIVVGSWYGTKPVSLDLGSDFHRKRQRITSSQVSTLAPALQGRWNKARRFDLALKKIAELQPHTLITHRVPFAIAADAYHLLDQDAGSAIQIILDYDR
jgi:2-desacetyl-2-hydroxyethyl bacteriochlorophyllide A dehydrogenase